MKRFQMLCALALPGLVLAACDRTPSEPSAAVRAEFLSIPSPSVETATVCKAYTGTATTDSFTFNGINTQMVGSPFRVAAETCRQVRLIGGDTTRTTVTEVNIAAGVQLDSVVTYQLNGATVTHTNLGAVTTGSVYTGGNPLAGGVIVFYNSDIPQQTFEYCSPGYWKNHTSAWVGYTSGQTLGSVFTLGSFSATFGSTTLLQALSFNGGPGVNGAAQILFRAAVGALLNASALNFSLTTSQIISAVNTALASNDRQTILNAASSFGAPENCPLD